MLALIWRRYVLVISSLTIFVLQFEIAVNRRHRTLTLVHIAEGLYCISR